jgi:hypothetical protein
MDGWDKWGYDSDQQFLRTKLKPIFEDSILIHCSKYINSFPVEPINDYYVGGCGQKIILINQLIMYFLKIIL